MLQAEVFTLAEPALFPYTTLFRSSAQQALPGWDATVPGRRFRRRKAGSSDRQASYARIDGPRRPGRQAGDRKSTRLNSSHRWISYAVFRLKQKNIMKYSKDLSEIT